MPKLFVLTTSRKELFHEIGEAWQAAGATGVTFIESHGLHKFQRASKKFEILPGMISMMEILRSQDEYSVTMFSVIENDDIVTRLKEATEKVIGDINLPDNGIIFVVDLEQAFGLRSLE